MIDERAFNQLSEPIRDLQTECSAEIVNVIMQRIGQIKEEPNTDSSASYDDLSEIGKIKNKYASKIRQNIELAVFSIVNLAYADCEEIGNLPKLKENRPILDLTNEIITAIILLYNGLNEYYVKTADVKNPRIKTYLPINKAYNQIVDKAKLAKSSNLDFDTLMHDVEVDLINGLKIQYQNAYYNSDSGLENIITQGLVDTAQEVYNRLGEQLNCNGVEISAHLAPAPDHAPCQGHQFTNQNWEFIQSGLDFIDVQGRHYIGFERHIGTCNCKHLTKPIIIGKTKPENSDYDLERILKANERGYVTKDGKHYTFYECTQKLNYFRRQMKKAENGIKLAEAAHNDSLKAQYIASYNHYKTMYDSFKEQLDKRLYVNN